MSEMNPDTEVLQRLANALEKHMKPSIPVSVDLWDVATIAAYLKRDPAVVRERIAVLPDFPKAIRLPANKGRAHPLWKAAEVIAWAGNYQEKH